MGPGRPLTRYQKQHLMKYVLKTIVMRLSLIESAEYIKRELGIDYAPGSLSRLRSELKQNIKAELNKLRKDHFEFKYQYMQRIKEIEWIIEQRHILYNAAGAKFYQKHLCLVELKDLSIVLNNFNELIPIMDRYNVVNGEFLDDISLRKPKVLDVVSEDQQAQEHAADAKDELPGDGEQPIFGINSRNSFLDKRRRKASESLEN